MMPGVFVQLYDAWLCQHFGSSSWNVYIVYIVFIVYISLGSCQSVDSARHHLAAVPQGLVMVAYNAVYRIVHTNPVYCSEHHHNCQ